MAKKKKTAAQIQAKENERWQAESDLRTLRQAEEIKSDGGRLRSARVVAKEELKALQKVEGSIAKAKGKKKKGS